MHPKSATDLFSLPESGVHEKTLHQTIPLAHTPTVTTQLWLCIYPNLLAVDAVAPNTMEPTLISEENGGRLFVGACNLAAEKYGITAGMSLTAALSLYHEFVVLPRDLMAEQQILNQLADWTLGLSSRVSIYAGESLVIEIKGSLRLFGGLKTLYEQVTKGINAFGLSYKTSMAPTTKAAFWLAKWGNGQQIESMEELPSTLRPLSINVLVQDERQLLRLQHSGITTLADFMRLPRDGMARRFGSAALKTLDQAIGRQPEPLKWYQSPYRFSKTRELYQPVSDFSLIKPIAVALLKEFETYLWQRQAITQHIQCRLIHRDGSETVVHVKCSQGNWQADHFFPLLEEHLGRLHLSEDVAAVTLFVDRIQTDLTASQLDLFDTTVGDEQNWRQFLEQIAARLGQDVIQCPLTCADYRPEQAIAGTFPQLRRSTRTGCSRPLWLLSRPELLAQSRKDLEIIPGIERIEQGWWDGDDVRRDYQIARGLYGNKLWIYFDRCQKHWFLQGYFG